MWSELRIPVIEYIRKELGAWLSGSTFAFPLVWRLGLSLFLEPIHYKERGGVGGGGGGGSAVGVLPGIHH